MSNIISKLKYLKETKRLIKEAIINKGVLVEDNDSFRSYANYIAEIPAAEGDYRLYKKCLDEVYKAMVGRGLQVDKNDPESFADKISTLRKIDLKFTFNEDVSSLQSIPISNHDIDVKIGLEDNLHTPGMYDPTVSGFSDDISSLSHIEIKKPQKIEVGISMDVNLSTSFE